MGENGGNKYCKGKQNKMYNLQLQKYVHDLNPASSTITTIIFTEKKINIQFYAWEAP